MKSILAAGGSFLLSIITANAFAQVVTTTFTVPGNCEMCKKTIETSVDVKGVRSAEWSRETQQLKVVHNAEKISKEKLMQLVAASGYDTPAVKADTTVYKKLPDCCKYKQEE